MAADQFLRTLFVHRAGDDVHDVATGKLRDQLDDFRHVPDIVSGLFGLPALLPQVRLERPATDRGNANGELRIPSGQHVGVQFVGKEVTEEAGTIGIILPPTEVVVGIERDVAFDLRAHPHGPVDVIRFGPGLDGVIPLAPRIVPHIAALAHHNGANFAGLDPFRGLVPLLIGATLGADLEQFSGLLRRILNAEGLIQIACHRLLDIDMLARLHGITGNRGMPMIDRGTEDDIDIPVFEELAVVLVSLDVVAASAVGDLFLRGVDPGGGNVANGSEGSVVFLVVGDVLAHVGSGTLPPHADVAADDFLVGSIDVGRGGLVLAVDGGDE